MENPRPEKVAVVDEVRERLGSTEAAVLTEYRGLSVSALATLRTALREAGADYKIYKNTLVRLAARDLGLDIEEHLVGPTAIAFVGTRPDGTPGDSVGLAKALREYAADDDKLVIKGGLLGDRAITAAEVVALSKIAPLEQMRAEFAGAMEYMLQDFAGLLDAKLREMSYAMQDLIDKGVLAPGEAPAAAEPEAPATEAEAPAAEADEAEAEAPAEAAEAVAADATEEENETQTESDTEES